MHYTGTIWRPPYEAGSLLLEVTAGCSHHRCKFCTLYADLPFPFRMSPFEDIEADLQEAGKKWRRIAGNRKMRTFLTGANPFVLSAEHLLRIADRIKHYFPENESIGCFARITDVGLKSDEELFLLKKAGYDDLTIGMETADDEALEFMNKGYLASDILTQCKRLEQAGISYRFFYLTGICGAGRGEQGAKRTAQVCNQLKPRMIGSNMLTIFPHSELYGEIKNGNWKEGSELEKYRELRTLVKELEIETIFAALGDFNAVQIYGRLPEDKEKIVGLLDEVIDRVERRFSQVRRF